MIERTTMEDRMGRYRRFELDGGGMVVMDARDIELAGGVVAALRRAGYDIPTPDPVPLFQRDRQLGTLPGYFDPFAIKSRTFLYDPRPGDFTRSERGWEATPRLGPGDIVAVPGFVPAERFADTARSCEQVMEGDRAILREILTGNRFMNPPRGAGDRRRGSGSTPPLLTYGDIATRMLASMASQLMARGYVPVTVRRKWWQLWKPREWIEMRPSWTVPRPIPPATGGTVKFRRPIPFPPAEGQTNGTSTPNGRAEGSNEGAAQAGGVDHPQEAAHQESDGGAQGA